MAVSDGVEDRVAAIRERILRTITLVFAVVAIPAILISVLRNQEGRTAFEPVAYWAVYTVWLTTGILMRRLLSYRFRAYTMCASLFVVGVWVLMQQGLSSGGELLLCTSCGITTAIIDRRAGQRLLLLSILAIAGIGWLVTSRILPVSASFPDTSMVMTRWLMGTAVFSVLTGALVATLGMMQRSLFDALGELSAYHTELENVVAARTAELHATNEELEAFAHSVSHDLRAPLRAIDGFSTALANEWRERLDERGRGHLQRVRGGVLRMTALIDALLQLSHLSRAPMKVEPVDLSALAAEIGKELQLGDPHRQVEFSITPDLMVRGDKDLLHAVLTNLLDNSWKFTSHHERARIEVGVQNGSGERVFYVRDDGAGFDMNYVKKMFDAFQRLHGVDEFEGTGIGLPLVQRVIRRHGGRVWAEGEVEKGAVVYFTLPGSGGGTEVTQ